MNVNSVQELLEQIYKEIEEQNNFFDTKAIPTSDIFYPRMAKKYDLIPFNIPELLEKLAAAHKIFIFNLVDEDLKNKILKVQGFIVTKGDIISKLRKCYEDELIKNYLAEYSEKSTTDKIIERLVSKLNEINNTSVGKSMRIVLKLFEYENTLEKDILKYSQRKQDELLKEQLEKSKPLNNYVIEPVENDLSQDVSSLMDKKPDTVNRGQNSRQHRSIDPAEYNRMKQSIKNESIESVINVYGIEFFTRICFREYQFLYIVSLIESGKIHKKDQLVTIKHLLQKERMSSDQDPNIQKFAKEINALEKIVNKKLSFM